MDFLVYWGKNKDKGGGELQRSIRPLYWEGGRIKTEVRQDESNVAATTNEKEKESGVDKLIRFVSIVASMVSSVFDSTNSR